VPIELIAKIGIGLLFGGLICSAVLSLIHRRAIKLTTRRLESAFQHSAAQVRGDKELLQIVLGYARAQMVELDKNESAINRLRSELDALKIEVESLKVKIEPTHFEHASFVSISPTTSQTMLEETWSRGNSEHQSIPDDTWTRDEPVSDGAMIPTGTQFSPADTSVDTWKRGVGEGELGVLLGFPSKTSQTHVLSPPVWTDRPQRAISGDETPPVSAAQHGSGSRDQSAS